MPKIIVPVANESFEEHFVNNGWNTPQDQIDAGYPIYLQPGGSYGKIVMEHDLGAVIASSIVAVTYLVTAISGTVTITPTLSYSLDGVTWTDNADVVQVFASNFQHVRLMIEATPDTPGSLAEIGDIRLTVAVKLKTDSGRGIGLASDNDADPNKGTLVLFNETYIDVNSITVSPHYIAAETKGVSYNVNFVDTANPTYFRVLFFSNLTGARIDCGFDWKARGV